MSRERRTDVGSVADTLEAIRRLDLLLCDCEGLARGIVRRAIAHLERSLLEHLTGTDASHRRLHQVPA